MNSVRCLEGLLESRTKSSDGFEQTGDIRDLNEFSLLMRLTEEETKVSSTSPKGTFEDMAAELGWTLEEVENFGTEFFNRVLEIRKRAIA